MSRAVGHFGKAAIKHSGIPRFPGAPDSSELRIQPDRYYLSRPRVHFRRSPVDHARSEPVGRTDESRLQRLHAGLFPV